MSDYYPPPEAVLPLFAQRMAPAVQSSMTSMQAADSLGPAALNELQRRVYQLLQLHPAGLTDEEIACRLCMNPSTARPRRIELFRLGLVVRGGIRKTKSGRNADAWRVA
jgi:DNA-binding NarL/FixJ family response regulator